MLPLLARIALLVVVSGCGSRVVRETAAGDVFRGKRVIVFLPGFYGSALADKNTGERVFLTSWSALFGKGPLALPNFGVHGARELIPDGVLTSVPIVPLVYSRDIYGEALSFLSGVGGKETVIVPFDYDWRADLHETVQRLDIRVRKISAEGATSIVLVAHSMGGLVATYYARYGAVEPAQAGDRSGLAPRLSGLVVLGAPLHGAMTAFRNLQFGTSLGPAKEPLAQESLATFPAMYHLVPTQAGMYRDRHFETLKAWSNRFELWQRQGLGLFRPPLTTDVALRERKGTALARYLERADLFHRKLDASTSQTSGVPTLFVIGTGYNTFARAVFSGESANATGRWLFSDEAMHAALPELAKATLSEDGDGTVPAASAQPSAGLQKYFSPKIFKAFVHHEEMFAHEKVRAAVAEFLTPESVHSDKNESKARLATSRDGNSGQ